jgi:hypothetical protein
MVALDLRFKGKGTQDFILGYLQPSLRDCIFVSTFTQDFVLGYFQPSLRDCFRPTNIYPCGTKTYGFRRRSRVRGNSALRSSFDTDIGPGV